MFRVAISDQAVHITFYYYNSVFTMMDGDDMYGDLAFSEPVVVKPKDPPKIPKMKGTVLSAFQMRMREATQPVHPWRMREEHPPVPSSSMREDPRIKSAAVKADAVKAMTAKRMPTSRKQSDGKIITVVPPPAKRPQPPDAVPLDKNKVYVSSLPYWIKKSQLSDYILEYAGISVDTAGIYLLLDGRDKKTYQSTAAMVPTTSEEDSLKIIQSIDGWPFHMYGPQITLDPMRAKFARRAKMVTLNITGTMPNSAPQVVPPRSKPPPSDRPQPSVNACIEGTCECFPGRYPRPSQSSHKACTASPTMARDPRLPDPRLPLARVQDPRLPLAQTTSTSLQLKEEQFSDDDDDSVGGVRSDPYLEPPSVAAKLESE